MSLPVEITDREAQLFNTLPLHEVAPALQELVYNVDQTVASRAFDALLKLNNVDKIQCLIDIYDESSVDWRIACCKKFANFSDSRSIIKLCEIAISDENPDVRYNAVEALSVIGDETALTTLEQVKLNDVDVDYEGFKIADIAKQAISVILQRTNASK